MEEVASQTCTSPKMPFRFTQSNWLPSTHSLSLEHWQANSTTPDNRTRYCVHIRVTLGEGMGEQPHLPTCGVDCWSSIYCKKPVWEIKSPKLWPLHWVGNPVLCKVLAWGGASLLHHTGCWAQLVGSSYLGWKNCTGGSDSQHDARRLLSYCGCHHGEENEGQRAWAPQGLRGATWSSVAYCNIDNWMPGLDEGASDREVGRTDDVCTHKYKWGSAHT